MKTTAWALVSASAALVAIGGVRIMWRADHVSPAPDLRTLEERQRQLAGFGPALAEMENRATKLTAALWTEAAVAAFIAELPPGWAARPLTADLQQGIALQRYAFSKDAALRDYGEFLRVLKKLESRPSTRIEAVTLALNPDGRRFATALITATLPLRADSSVSTK